jgi:hypothetical protein
MSSSDNGLNFSNIEPIELPVTVGSQEYTLREASGGAACRYRNALIECTRLGPEGKPTHLKGIASIEPLLVSLCLFDSNNKRVPVQVIEGWPARVQKALFNKAQEISELNEDDTEETVEQLEQKLQAARTKDDDQSAAKNELSGIQDGSD